MWKLRLKLTFIIFYYLQSLILRIHLEADKQHRSNLCMLPSKQANTEA